MFRFRFQVLVLLLLGALACTAAAESAPLFCKCTCFKNSTLIQLSGPGRGQQASCAECTRGFCLAQNLPICKAVVNADTDVFSACIQRDSRKDQIIVWGFILGTAGLLAWAAAKRVNEMRAARKATATSGRGLDDRARGPYTPVAGTELR
ncbi:hypothetical protein F4777DRAFT_93779 [Nemania sp. FL0916]|nr:hypothetical protein F4777DRAFT_93779 [Nemania sp. FL0916]